MWIGQQCIVILPDKEIDLGIVGADEVVVSTTRMTPNGPEHGAEKIKTSQLEARQREWAAAKQRFVAGSGDTAGR